MIKTMINANLNTNTNSVLTLILTLTLLIDMLACYTLSFSLFKFYDCTQRKDVGDCRGRLFQIRMLSIRQKFHTFTADIRLVWLITASDHIEPHRTASDHIWPNLTKLSRDVCNGHAPPVNHTLAYSRKCLTYMMLEENPLFHARLSKSLRVPSGLQSPAYWELDCSTDCWRHVRNR